MIHRFSWVELLLDQISSYTTEQTPEDAWNQALQSVGARMNETYGKILELIYQKSQSKRALVERVLICTAYSRKPILIQHLACIVLERLDCPPSSIQDIRTIVDVCANLLTVDKDQMVGFVHPSAQKFLINYSSIQGETLGIQHELRGQWAHRAIAISFIKLLSALYSLSPADFANMEESFQQLGALLSEWPRHVLAASFKNHLSRGDELVCSLLSFLKYDPPVPTPYTVQSPKNKNTTVYFRFSSPTWMDIFGLAIAPEIVPKTPEGKDLMKVHVINQDFVIISNDHLALHYIVSVLKHPHVTKTLHRLVEFRGPYDPRDIFKSWDLDCKSDSWRSIPYQCQLPPLFSADSYEMADCLLMCGASLDTKCQSDEVYDPLIFFVEKDNVGVTKLLLGKLSDKEGTRRETALRYALEKDKVEVLQLLWNTGDGIGDLVGEYGTILQLVACHGHVEAVTRLLDQGADVNARGGKCGSALQVAVAASNVGLVKLLLDRGAKISDQDKYGNALHLAAHVGEDDVIKLLLCQKADVNALDEVYGNVLQAAVFSEDVEIVQLVLDQGADVNGHGGAYGNALQAAAICGNDDIVKLLLDWKADVNADGGVFGNALQAAIVYDHFPVVRRLLAFGADVNAKGGIYGTALQAASYVCQITVVKLLLKEGADVNAPGGKYGMPLQAALTTVEENSGSGRDRKTPENIFRLIDFLLEKGADITAFVTGSKYGNAVTAAQELWKDDSPNFTKLVQRFDKEQAKRVEEARKAEEAKKAEKVNRWRRLLET